MCERKPSLRLSTDGAGKRESAPVSRQTLIVREIEFIQELGDEFGCGENATADPDDLQFAAFHASQAPAVYRGD